MSTAFLVEDEQSLLKLYKIILQKKGYKIKGTANNGANAIKKYKKFKEKPDFIIMDHRMPVKSGLDTAREILEIDPNAKIILATADKSIEQKAKKLGIASFKPKPFDNEYLIENIEKVLKRK
jgi:two-component system chemotaxis response regulator CheY